MKADAPESRKRIKLTSDVLGTPIVAKGTASDSDDEGEEVAERKRRLRGSADGGARGSGLASLLPPPKVSAGLIPKAGASTTASAKAVTLVPPSVARAALASSDTSKVGNATRPPAASAPPRPAPKDDDSDDDQTTTGSANLPFPMPAPRRSEPRELPFPMPARQAAASPGLNEAAAASAVPSVDVAPSASAAAAVGYADAYQQAYQYAYQMALEAAAQHQQEAARAQAEHEAAQLRRLQGKRAADMPVEIKEVTQVQTKYIPPPPEPPKLYEFKAVRNVSDTERRKHQITFMAHFAKAKEADINERLQRGMKSRRETAAKYGF